MRPTELFCSVSDEGAKPAVKCMYSSNQNMTWSMAKFRDNFINVFVTNLLLSRI